MVKIYRISVLMFAILFTGCRSEAMSQSDLSSAVETQNTISNIQLKYLAGIRKKANEERLRECMKIVGLDPANDKTVGKHFLLSAITEMILKLCVMRYMKWMQAC